MVRNFSGQAMDTPGISKVKSSIMAMLLDKIKEN
jgi:hypothetical protein